MNDVKRMESLVAAFSLKHAGYPFLLSANMSNRNWICPPIKTRGKKKKSKDKTSYMKEQFSKPWHQATKDSFPSRWGKNEVNTEIFIDKILPPEWNIKILPQFPIFILKTAVSTPQSQYPHRCLPYPSQPPQEPIPKSPSVSLSLSLCLLYR